MNRRELAKKGFLGLCAAVLGKKIHASANTVELTISTENEGKTTCRTYRASGPAWEFLADQGEGVYHLSDGTET